MNSFSSEKTLSPNEKQLDKRYRALKKFDMQPSSVYATRFMERYGPSYGGYGALEL